MLVSLLHCVCLQHDGAFVSVDKCGDGASLTVRDIAARCGLSPSTVWRCLGDLVDAGLLSVTPQVRRKLAEDAVIVSACIRSFTRKFWAILDLWEAYLKCVKWAKEHGRIQFVRTLFKKVRGKMAPLIRQVVKLATTVRDGPSAPPAPLASAPVQLTLPSYSLSPAPKATAEGAAEWCAKRHGVHDGAVCAKFNPLSATCNGCLRQGLCSRG